MSYAHYIRNAEKGTWTNNGASGQVVITPPTTGGQVTITAGSTWATGVGGNITLNAGPGVEIKSKEVELLKPGEICYIKCSDRAGPYAILEVSKDGVGDENDDGEWVPDTEEPCYLLGGNTDNLPAWAIVGSNEQTSKEWVYAAWCMPEAEKLAEDKKVQEERKAKEEKKNAQAAAQEAAQEAAKEAAQKAAQEANAEWWATYSGDIARIALGIGSTISGLAAMAWLLCS